MKKLLIIFIFAMLLVPTLMAEQDSLGTFQKDDCIDLIQICGTCTYSNITSIILPNSTRLILDETMTRRGAEYNYTFCETDLLGTYSINGVADLEGTDNAWAYDLKITSTGEEFGLESILVYIFLALFFIGLCYSYYGISSRMDFDKWYESIIKKYQDKNKIKVTLSSIAYTMVKETFITYYLLFFPVMLLLNNLIEEFGVLALTTTFEAIFVIYLIGLIFVGLIFFGKVQEFFTKLLKDIEDDKWGIMKE